MKILYHFRTQGTGAEGVHIAGVANAFTRLGHEVIFSSPTSVDPRTKAGDDPFGGKKKQRSFLSRLAAHAPGPVFECLELGYNVASYLRLRGQLARHSFGFIYERHAFFLAATALLAQRRRIPLVVEVNELAGDERVRTTPWLAPLARMADRITFQRASLIVVVSPHLKRRIVTMGIPEERVLVLPNAVDETSLDIPTNAVAVREKYRCSDALVIGFVGWFVPWHRLEALVALFAGLATSDPRLRLMLAGDGPLAEALANRAQTLGVRDRVIFTGPIPHTQIPDHISAMDICVVPHSNEYRSPIKLFEYMACGRAVVAPRTEPIAAVVDDGVNGLLFDPENPRELASQITCLIAAPEERERLGSAARQNVAARHTWRRNAEAVFAKIRPFLSDDGAKPASYR